MNFCDNVFWKFGRAGNRESFSANEGEDVKQRNFFTANKKHYTVYVETGTAQITNILQYTNISNVAKVATFEGLFKSSTFVYALIHCN